MKNLITIMLLGAFTAFNAQVIIGNAVGTATNKTSVLLEFANTDNNKGIIVPYVRTLPTASVANQGTILLDASTPATARMKYSNGTNWNDLSGQAANVASALIDQPSLSVVETGAKSIIGATTSTADGVLVLESNTKAMILPIVSDVNNIPSPSPGMLVYVNKTGAKRLAVFNGSKWSFWKP